LNPDKSLLDKLGVKAGARVAVIGVDDLAFLDELRTRTTNITFGQPRDQSDLIFIAVDAPAELMALGGLRPHLKPDGAIWVVRRKGADRTLREVDVIEAGRFVGLVDNKIASFSDTHGAMRLVIPLAQRPARS
jgi:hypothetical protein